MEFPTEEALAEVDDQFMLGESLLVKPVAVAGATSVRVVLPKTAAWYDYHGRGRVEAAAGQALVWPVTLDRIPIFVKAGSIVPQKDRLRRSTAMMEEDPVSLYVFTDEAEEAQGWVYFDDGTSMRHQTGGEYCEARCSLKNGLFKWSITSKRDATATLRRLIRVDRILVFGLPAAPKAVRSSVGGLHFVFEREQGGKRWAEAENERGEDEEGEGQGQGEGEEKDGTGQEGKAAPVLQIRTLNLDFSQSLEIKLVPFPDDL